MSQPPSCLCGDCTTCKRRAYRQRDVEAHPEKTAARKAVAKALKSGELERKPCRVCGEVKTQAHHDDYQFPLAVIWLCQTHHWERHKMLARVKRLKKNYRPLTSRRVQGETVRSQTT